jgi:hypothetical protein
MALRPASAADEAISTYPPAKDEIRPASLQISVTAATISFPRQGQDAITNAPICTDVRESRRRTGSGRPLRLAKDRFGG